MDKKIKYTLALHTQGCPPGGYLYSLDLSQNEEENPKQYFTEYNKQLLQNTLQNLSACAIREAHLNEIINAWIEDIQEGYRETRIDLPNLPLLFEANVEKLQDKGNQEFPILFPPDLSGIEPTFGMLPPLKEIYTP